MHIVHLSAVNNWGGGENHIENLCKELQNTYPEVKNTIFCVKDKVFHNRLKQTNLDYVTPKLAVKFDPRYFIKLGFYCKKHKVDVIHIHDTSAIVLAILADKFFALPPFVFSKKTSFPIKQRKKTLYKYNYPKIKKILCVSEETKNVTAQAITDHNKLITIYHGTNLATKSSQTDFLLREKYNIPTDKIIIGNIANHIRAKHLDTWIDVANEIINVKKDNRFYFVQIGTFTERTEPLLDRMNELGLEKHMSFLGYTPNASNFIPQFDITLITSQSEGVPQVIYESFYHKTPVISTDVGGIPEIIQHKVNGLLAPMHQPVPLADCITELANDKELQEKFITISYQKLLDNYTTAQMAAHTMEIYTEIVNQTH
ncbi:glycosyltransferase family 4 protein [Aquimarina brevivitae]|uniref:Glycosyltransferase involved in cell wall biosynthesis n=1 Tax=Aquimarina brevivitae TaxID=323412 RepID=A0A4Q7PMS9_9FLAO|nr:glycosyltransferase family 4 protein [Aquimarina brevivitae]RZT00343.1 glycosyltransferase involved in cell wall biosynthesis [Aquimarina brevivitae]